MRPLLPWLTAALAGCPYIPADFKATTTETTEATTNTGTPTETTPPPTDTATTEPSTTDTEPTDTGPVDEDGDGEPAATDCDDNDSSRFPGNDERCDDIDNDCDDVVDEGLPTLDYYEDLDGDGFGSGTPIAKCDPIPGRIPVGGDCNDLDLSIHPGAADPCNDVDDDCDNELDEDATFAIYFVDGDGDGFGNPGAGVYTCNPDPALVTDDTDCDDAQATVNPDIEVDCSETIDVNCDGLIGEDLVQVYTDDDQDGYGTGLPRQACEAPGPTEALVDGDCDDNEALAHPGHSELCLDSIDNNCDTVIDEPIVTVAGVSWPAEEAQAALDGALAGDLVEFCTDHHATTETLTIRSGITLRSADAFGQATFTAGADIAPITVRAGTEDVVIENIRVTGAVNEPGIYLPEAAHVELRDALVDSHANDNSAGGIHSAVPLTVTDSIIEYNTATYAAGILCQDAPLVLAGNTEVRYNEASSWGGGVRMIDAPSLTFLDQARIHGNSADRGGGLSLTLNDATLPRPWVDATLASAGVVQIDFNTAVSHGGGIYAKESVDLTELTISNNDADLGGGLFFDTPFGTSATWTGLEVTQNTATSAGGAYVDDAVVTMESCTFTENATAIEGNGGALRLQASNAIISNSTFSDNTAGLHGGAVHLRLSAIATFTDTSFTNNRSSDRGGAIFSDDSPALELKSCTFTSNDSVRGSAVAASDGEIMVEEATFSNNGGPHSTGESGRGGALWLNITDSTILGAEFSGNEAQIGGAIYGFDGRLSIEGSSFAQNSSINQGGALYLTTVGSFNNTDHIESSSFTGNTASDGGAMHLVHENYTISVANPTAPTTLTDNRSEGGTGHAAIYLSTDAGLESDGMQLDAPQVIQVSGTTETYSGPGPFTCDQSLTPASACY